MQATEAYRRAQRQNALRSLGIDPEKRRTFAEEVRLLGLDGDLLALPFLEGGGLVNPATGNLYFVAGLSAVGGPDEVMG